MNIDTFFEQFDSLIELPGGVAKIRELILELACRGSFLESRNMTSDLVARETFCLGERAAFIMGQAPPGPDCNLTGEGTLFVKVGEFGDLYPERKAWTTKPLKFAKSGDVLICVVGATVGKLNLGIDCAIGRSVAAIRPDKKLDSKFLYYSLMPYVLKLRSSARGSAQGVIGRSELSGIRIWIPSIDEQGQNVAKVDQLMALCDELEARQERKREGRERLVESSLAKLLAARDPAELADCWNRIHDRFNDLVKAGATVSKLRGIVLQLAMQGKLAPQDRMDEPARYLLERVMQMRNDADTGKRNSISDHMKRFDSQVLLPESWAWSTFGDVAEIASSLVPPSKFPDHPHIAPDNIEKGTGRLLEFRTVAVDGVRSAKHRFFAGQILYSKIRPNLAKTTIVDFEGLCSADMYPINSYIDSRYLLLYMLSPMFLGIAVKNDTRVAMPKINQEELNAIPVPVPPLAEQRRIVAKVDQLMALCDQLETRLDGSQLAGDRLLTSSIASMLESIAE